MAGNAKGKLRTLYIMQMLQDETDAEHGLSMAAILARLSEQGVTVDRKTVYTDIKTLRDFGLDIQTYQRNPVEYAIERRDFTLDELMIMVDAVQSCRFITQKQSDRLVRNIKLLASDAQREKLNRLIHVDGRLTGRQASVFGKVDAVHEAMRARRKLSFTYWKMGVDGEWHIQHSGKPYVVTPVKVSFDNNFYYLTAWSDKHGSMTEYRIDRMRDITACAERATSSSKIGDHEYRVRDSQYFGHFDGELVNVTLGVDEEMVGVIFDRFGKDARISACEDGTAKVHVSVRKSWQFFGWVAGLCGKVRIEEPASLLEEYRAYLRALADGDRIETL